MLRKREQAEGKTVDKNGNIQIRSEVKKYQITEEMIQDAMHKEPFLANLLEYV